MDIFRFYNPFSPTRMEQGEIIEGIKSKMWVERYASAGEFTFVSDHVSEMKEKLPVGTFVSHVDSTDLMIVENHRVKDSDDGPAEITITGRGAESYLDHRIVGSNKNFPTSNGVSEYIIAANNLPGQIVTLIKQHILESNVIDSSDAIPFFDAIQQISYPSSDDPEELSVKRGGLYTRVLELLEIQGLGIKMVRPGHWSPYLPSTFKTAIVIHDGTDRSSWLLYSYHTGDIKSIDHLWSYKKLKNAAFVAGRWVSTTYSAGLSNYNKRTMFVDASDIDNHLTAAPVGTALTNIVDRMQRRGKRALAQQKMVSLSNIDLSKSNVNSDYRVHFNIGDIVMVEGNYNKVEKQRITEYAEIEDENGTNQYPTFTSI